MHLMMILWALGLAWFLRTSYWSSTINWKTRAFTALILFLFSPLLLITTAFALLYMGPTGKMVGLQSGWFSYLLALGFLIWSAVKLGRLSWEGWGVVRKIRAYPLGELEGKSCRILETNIPYSALIGFWQPELVVSEGLLQTLDRDHLQAVITHEQAHYYYRDTFWFFWLGWLRSITFWLPNTENLWQELLVLRELRADNWAAKSVDPLTLAESLLLVVSPATITMTNLAAEFSAIAPTNRLNERVEALLVAEQSGYQISWWFWVWLLPVFLPLAAIPFHK